METRNTKQKEIILDIMRKKENQVHPTMSEIIAMVLEEDKILVQQRSIVM